MHEAFLRLVGADEPPVDVDLLRAYFATGATKRGIAKVLTTRRKRATA